MNINIKKKTGFTLIELVIVISIIGILSVVAAPKFVDLTEYANEAVVKRATNSIRSAASLFQAQTLLSKSPRNEVVVFSDVFGSNYQPLAHNYEALGQEYTMPPEIFKAAGLDIADWSYRVFETAASNAVVAAPKNVLSLTEPTINDVRHTDCYLEYEWREEGTPLIKAITKGCNK